MKKNFYSFILLAATFLAQAGWATIPEVLRGGWTIDAVATAENLKNSPKWDKANANVMRVILERMSAVVCTFDKGVMTVSDGVKENALAVELKTSEARLYVFAGKSGDDEVTIRASFTEEGLLNIRTSTTDDMDYYLWKRMPKGLAPTKMELPPAALRLLKKAEINAEEKPST